MQALHGLKILVPESRELDLFAAMLEAEGASAVRRPLVRILDLEDSREAERWIEDMIALPFDDLVLLTGDGLRKLVTLSGARRDAFIGALEKTCIVTRGPKPARALREIGLMPTLAAPVPTSQGVLEALAGKSLEGRRIGVQAYPGDGAHPLIAALEARGARVFPITPYRYASDTENAGVAGVIRELAAGAFDLVAFTATPQLDRLFAVAKEEGLVAALAEGLARTPIAAIGPVVRESLRAHGISPAVEPQASFHLKPLVRAIIAWRQE